MKKLLKIFLFCFMINHQAGAQDYKEYGIVLIVPEEYYTKALKMNHEIAMQVPEIENTPNVFHVTLFHARLAEDEVFDLYKKLKKQNFKKVKIEPEPIIKSVEGQYIIWQVKKTNELKNLHKQVVKIANNYRHGMVFRYAVSYDELSEQQRQKVDKYGVIEVLDEYNPHVTLFYFPQKNPDVEEIADKISPPDITREIKGLKGSMAIVELGYEGNAERVLYMF
jgi:2'-5' RNA ligase